MADGDGEGSMTAAVSDLDLYLRGAETLVASWQEYARGARCASVRRFPSVAAAVFPNEPERSVYNNGLLARGLSAAARTDALDAMEAAYAAAGVTQFAAWVHESEKAMRSEIERRGYKLDTSTRAMGMELRDVRLPRPTLDLGKAEWLQHLRIVGVPHDFLENADPSPYHVLIARLAGENVATAMAFDHAGDCGIYNVGTVGHARGRGIGTALTALHSHDALGRGCTTCSVQATPMAEGVYATAGFRDLGRILEYVPPRAGGRHGRTARGGAVG
jgi:hypothetical protein